MWKVAALLCALILATIPLSFLNGHLASGVAAALSSCSLLAAIATVGPGERAFLRAVTGPFLLVGLIPLGWILIQMLPLPWLANPAWKAAQDVLGRPVAGSISVNLGITLEVCLNYLTGLTTCVAAAAVAIDPRRAHWCVYSAVAAAAVLALMGTLSDLSLPAWQADPGIGTSIAAALITSPLCLANVLEAFGTGRRQPTNGFRPSYRGLGFAAAGVVEVVATCTIGGLPTLVPLAAGSAVVILVWTARSFRMALWSSASIFLTLAAIGIGIVVASPLHPGVPFEIAFSAAPDAAIATTQSVLADLPLAGTGAGTAVEMLRTYQELQDASAVPAAASAAAATIIGLGKPVFWTMLVVALLGVAALFKGSLQRGRNWSFASSAAGALVAMSVASFEFQDLISVPSIILLAAIIGLGLAQRVGRTRS